MKLQIAILAVLALFSRRVVSLYHPCSVGEAAI